MTVSQEPLRGSTALVTGAAGFLGGHLTDKLVDRGVRVRVLVRPTTSTEALKGIPVRYFFGDVTNERDVWRALQDVNYVFHLASTYRHAKVDRNEHYRVHVLGTQNVAEAAARLPSLKRFVHVSTVGVHGRFENPPANEEYPFVLEDEYQKTKAQAELWVRAFAKRRKMPLAVVRPAAIYGPGDKRLFKVFKWVHAGWFPMIGEGESWFHLVHVNDLTHFMLKLATHLNAVGEAFICAAEKPLQLKEMIAVIADAFRRNVKCVHLPENWMFKLAELCETVCRPFNIAPPFFKRRTAFFTQNRVFNVSKAKRLLGFSPQMSNEQGLSELARWYVQKGWLGGGKTRDARRSAFRIEARRN